MDKALIPSISVKYQSTPALRALRVLFCISPIWAIWAPGMAIGILSTIQSTIQMSMENVVVCAFVATGLLTLTLISSLSLWICLQSKLTISSAGIKFPHSCLLQLKGKLFYTWNSLLEVNFVDSKISLSFLANEPDTMVLKFKNGAALPLSLRVLSKKDLESFLIALSSNAPELSINPPLPELRLGIAESSTLQKASSFTRIWEDDMASRFGSTVFAPLESGDKLQNGKLEILGQIAFGGLSAVYLAAKANKELCVLKEFVLPLSADKASKQKAEELFEREAKLLMEIKHERIACLLDYFIEDKRQYLLLEYRQGKDLRRCVKEKGPFSERTALRICLEISEILKYLHHRNPPIIHRDLTPDNLMLEEDGRIALIDFGAANEFLATATGTLVGKQSYIAPEQFRGKARPASDYYALGATLFFLLTGQDPEALSQSRPKELNPELSDEMDKLIADLTAMELDSRITTPDVLHARCLEIQSSFELGVALSAIQ